MAKKIVHLVYSFGIGGLESVIVNLIKNSSSYDVEHVVISLVDVTDSYVLIDGMASFYVLDKKEGNDFSSHVRLYRLLKKLKPDVLHTYNFGTIEYQLTGFLARVKKRVHCDHGYGGDDTSGKNKFRMLIRRFVSYILDDYIVVSPDLMEWCVGEVKINKKKLHLVFNGVDTERFSPSRNKDPKYTICNISRVDAEKNQALLVNAYILACEKNEDFKNNSQLVIIGDGPVFSDLKKMVEVNGVGVNIQLLGHRMDVSEELRKSHLFALTSLYEAMPMTILEAMACEVPVMSTDVGGVKYLLSDNEGWLIKENTIDVVSDQLLHLYVNEGDVAGHKASIGKIKVDQFYTVENMVKKYMDLYQM